MYPLFAGMSYRTHEFSRKYRNRYLFENENAKNKLDDYSKCS